MAGLVPAIGLLRSGSSAAQISGKSMTEVRVAAMAEQSIKEMIDPKDRGACGVSRVRCGEVDQRPGVADR
jgi:hypothetical protein